MNKIIRYFDLASGYRSGEFRAVGDNPLNKVPDIWLQWVALFLGVFIQPIYKSYITDGSWYAGNMIHWLLISAIISFVLFPMLYKEALDPAKKKFPQLCFIFTGGLGWQSIIATAVDAATKHH